MSSRVPTVVSLFVSSWALKVMYFMVKSKLLWYMFKNNLKSIDLSFERKHLTLMISTFFFFFWKTGSGKTHTLTGPPDLVGVSSGINQPSILLPQIHPTHEHTHAPIPCWVIYLIFFQFIGIGKPEPTDYRHGLVFRAFLYLFQLLQERKDTNFVLKASFLEIYNEKVSQNAIRLIQVETG